MSRPPQSHTAARGNAIAGVVGRDLDVVGVEVGVFAGDLSRYLVEQMPRLTLFLVDTWAVPAGATGYGHSGDPHAQCSQEEHDGYYAETLAKVEGFGWRVNVERRDSVKASEWFEDFSLDFVFLDADHTYEGVRSDLLAWAPKVRAGGVLCGHDYANGPYEGVRRAVDEFAAGRHVELGDDFTWFMRLP